MILYHGTSFERAKIILKAGLIKRDAKQNYDECPMSTTEGFVYLTNNICRAIKYAANTYYLEKQEKRKLGSHSIINMINALSIFKWDINESLLQPDLDEYKIIKKLEMPVNTTYEQSLKDVYSTRISRDINLLNSCKGFTVLPAYDVNDSEFFYLSEINFSDNKKEKIIIISKLVKSALQAGNTVRRINEGRYQDTSFIEWKQPKLNESR